MTDQEVFDPFAVLAALGVTHATTAIPVHGGQDAVIWRVEHGSHVSALRVFQPDQLRGMQRETQTIRAAIACGLPVPDVRVEGVWNERPAMLLAWCPGETLLAAIQRQPWRVWAFGAVFGRMQARIHAVTAPESLQGTPDAWLDWVGPLDARLLDRLRATATSTDALLHLDYHPLNVMTDGGHITGVLDWPNARAGDPRADLARTAVLLHFRPTVSVRPHEAAAMRLFLRAWWYGYQWVAGPVRDMGPFYALAGAQTVRDQERKVGLPGRTIQSRDLDPLRRWTAAWMRRIGIDE